MIDKMIKMKNKQKAAALPISVRQALKEMGELIACTRKEKKWTQEELGRRIGVNRMTVVRIEKGAPEVATGWYLTAAWLLGLPILTWQAMGGETNDTVFSDLLAKLKKSLPGTIRQRGKKINNDF